MIVDTIYKFGFIHQMHFVCECVWVRVPVCLAHKLEEHSGSVSLIKEPDTMPHFLSPSVYLQIETL